MPRSRHRHFEALRVPLDAAQATAKALDGTVNTFFVTGAVIGVLAYHEARQVSVDALNISFVVSTREDRSTGGNAMTPTRLQVPGHTMGPAERFGVISQRLAARRAEVRGRGMLAGLAGVANLLPTSVVTSVARSQAGKIDFATSNLRGARSAQYVSGAKVLHKLAFGPVAGTAFNLTGFSYNGRFDMALAVDPAAVEEPAELRQHLQDEPSSSTQAAPSPDRLTVGSGLGELVERVLEAVRVEHQVGSISAGREAQHDQAAVERPSPWPGWDNRSAARRGTRRGGMRARFVAAHLGRHETVSAVEVIGGGGCARTESRVMERNGSRPRVGP
jgi:hypothetical protein